MAKPRKPSYLHFDTATYPWKPDIDYRAHPERTVSAKASKAF
jgi:hypothetical protein